MTFAAALFALSIAAAPGAGLALTFDEALALAAGRTPAAHSDDPLRDLRGPRLPDVRIETSGSATRALDPFTANPLETEAATTVVAFDYPLFDGGARRAQLEALEARTRHRPQGLSEARFAEIVEAFGDLYLGQQQETIIRPLQEKLVVEAERAARLLSSAEISNLEASNRRTLATAFMAQLLEVEARREDAAARLVETLGLQTEPAVVLDPSPAPDSLSSARKAERVDPTQAAVEESRARARAVAAASGFTATLSGLAGAAIAHSEFNDVSSSGTYGIYGLRVHLSYPLFRSSSLAAAEARVAMQESLRAQEEFSAAARQRIATLRREEQTAERRIELLEQQIEEARLAAASVQRLANAGLRSSADVIFTQAEVERRRLDLLAAQVQRWKTAQRLRWLTDGQAAPRVDGSREPRRQ
jgi:outer membrane protein TolC